jgi:hypothetical protein
MYGVKVYGVLSWGILTYITGIYMPYLRNTTVTGLPRIKKNGDGLDVYFHNVLRSCISCTSFDCWFCDRV